MEKTGVLFIAYPFFKELFFMFDFKKAVAATCVAAMLMVPVASVYADETTSSSDTTATTQTTETSGAAVTSETSGDETASETSTPSTIDLSNLSFDTMYGSQLNAFLNHQYSFNGEDIPIYESNFYFINAFLELSNYAYNGYYPTTSEGYLDLAASYDGDTYSTYADFYVDYAENMLESTCIICDMAASEGLELSDDTYTQIDTMIDNLNTNTAQPAGMSIDDYLKLYYGPDMDEAAFRDTLYYYYLSDLYSKNYCSDYAYTDSDKNIPNVRYALFKAPSGSDDATLESAESAANDLLSQCTSTDDLSTKAAALVDAGTVAETNDIAVTKGDFVQEFEDWAYDPARTEGEMAVVKSEDYGYFVVGYLGTTAATDDQLNSIALAALSKEVSDIMDAGTYDFHTDDTYAPAVAVPTAAADAASTDASVTASDTSTADTTAAAVAPSVRTGTAAIILTVLAIVGAVAIVAVVTILIVFVVKGNKDGKKDGSSSDKSEDGDAAEKDNASSAKASDDSEGSNASEASDITDKPVPDESEDSSDDN